MIKNPKAKGARMELRSKEILEKAGYRITKSGGSLGCWDLIGIGDTDFVLCQVKSSQWPGTLEMMELQEFRCPKNCKKIVHRWRKFQRLPDVRII